MSADMRDTRVTRRAVKITYLGWTYHDLSFIRCNPSFSVTSAGDIAVNHMRVSIVLSLAVSRPCIASLFEFFFFFFFENTNVFSCLLPRDFKSKAKYRTHLQVNPVYSQTPSINTLSSPYPPKSVPAPVELRQSCPCRQSRSQR